MSHSYFSYWGKASPAIQQQNQPQGQQQGQQQNRYHLLPFHALDVAACGAALIELPHFSLTSLADELQWPREQVNALFVFFLAIHDLGKFARAFQGLVPHLSPALVPPVEGKRYLHRHDTLGWMLWFFELTGDCPAQGLPDPAHECWSVWVRSVVGHHGKPPQENASGGVLQFDVNACFMREDRRAARDFVADASALLLPAALPVPDRAAVAVLKRHTWRLAGLAVLADWLGSSQTFFPYRSEPLPLSGYWDAARPQAAKAVEAAGLHASAIRDWPHPQALFDYLDTPTPLQQHAAAVELAPGPQLFLLEDVTGAGKTEAALILAQRLMQAGRASGLYFALPSMATANQMYRRVGSVYRKLYEADAQPSLILAHGARELVEGFRQSVLQVQDGDRAYLPDEGSASLQCNAWLADNRKKALLAEVGVGTLDQALMAILPARHQSLRLLGLAGKVLVVDEVHGYDAYMLGLLRTLLKAHAQQGGSVILLSATLPLAVRDALLSAYRQGLGVSDDEGLQDARYPLAVQAGTSLRSHACATRPQVRRRVTLRAVHDEDEVVRLIVEQARAGRCVAWIRNTVEDARRAHQRLVAHLPEHALLLFHSRYAMADRLDIEEQVLTRFGKHSTVGQRRGAVLIGTQVLEQSLDFDVCVMVSDLAPIDLLIQRAGRLHRHARLENGDPAADGIERRTEPTLYLLTPEAVDVPKVDWYASLFPKACYVYPDAGRLWLGARALLRAGCIVTPGEAGQPGAVRALVEAVYGEEAEPVPDALYKASQDQIGKDMAMRSQANFNALRLGKGYCIDSSDRWYEDHEVPTRLGDETLTVYLARCRDGELRPLRDEGEHAWAQSALRIHARHARALSPDWQQRFDAALQRLRRAYQLLEAPAFVLPLVEAGGNRLVGQVLNERGAVLEMRYERKEGLSW